MLAALLSGCTTSERPAWVADDASEPVLFAPGIVSGDERDYGIALSPDGLEAFFTRRGRRGPSQLLTARFDGTAWSEPEPVPFGWEGDQAPWMTPDGRQLYFSSSRPLPGSGDRSDNLWVATRAADDWSEPVPIPGAVNRPGEEIDDFDLGDEWAPTLFVDGSLLYATRTDPEWGSDLYVAAREADGSFAAGRPLRINSYGDETHPAVSPDGRFLVFQAYRDAEALGDQDLYVSERTEWGWSDPVPLPEPINSPRADGYPSFSADGSLFFFASDRAASGGYYDIYYVDVDVLGLRAAGR